MLSGQGKGRLTPKQMAPNGGVSVSLQFPGSYPGGYVLLKPFAVPMLGACQAPPPGSTPTLSLA